MTAATTTSVDTLRLLITDALALGPRGAALTVQSPLLGAVPELDSLAVAILVTAIEEHFGIVFDDADLTEETFATLGSLVQRIDAYRQP